jgi:hypothetical protein
MATFRQLFEQLGDEFLDAEAYFVVKDDFGNTSDVKFDAEPWKLTKFQGYAATMVTPKTNPKVFLVVCLKTHRLAKNKGS